MINTGKIWKSKTDRLTILLLLGIIFVATDNTIAAVDHSNFGMLNKEFATASEVTQTCLMC
ncbi:MAG: hypothetical protein ACYS6K_12130, partial [Planctomycetota bacterium]